VTEFAPLTIQHQGAFIDADGGARVNTEAEAVERLLDREVSGRGQYDFHVTDGAEQNRRLTAPLARVGEVVLVAGFPPWKYDCVFDRQGRVLARAHAPFP
jgi:hypothetical protein